MTELRGKYSPVDPVAYGAAVVCPEMPKERVLSSVAGDNGLLIQQAASLWISGEDRVIDVTYGRGVFWSRSHHQPFGSDIGVHAGQSLVADCRALPYRSRSIDVAVFDPPYQPVHGNPSRSFGVGRSYRLEQTKLQTISDVLDLYDAGIAECSRVLRGKTGRLMVKCQDLTYNHRLHLVHLDVLRLMAKHGIDLADMFILTNRSRMPQPTQRQQRAHRSHSYLLIGQKT